jgi:glycosyltransferase involved in cell wall biosynthesis
MANGKIKKRLAWHIFQRRDLRLADAFRATSEMEAEEIRRHGYTQPIAVIPNGVVTPEPTTSTETNRPKKVMLFLSRVHPKKGLENLFMAWKKAKMSEEWILKIVGPVSPAYRDSLEQKIHLLDLSEAIHFFPPTDDEDKWDYYREADLFVLPSFSENFGIVVAEALVAGTPVLTTTGTPWNDLTRDGIGWVVEPTVESLFNGLMEVRGRSIDSLSEMGINARKWATARFSWQEVGKEMSCFYEWLVNRGERPNSVRE